MRVVSLLDPGVKDRAFAEKCDADDEFKEMRNNFSMPKAAAGSDRSEAIYLCGNSLGAMPVKAREYVDAELDKWGTFGASIP